MPSALDSPCVSWTVCVCQGHFVSVLDIVLLSWTVCVCHGQPVSVMDSMCLSWTTCVCHKKSMSVSNTFLCIFHAELGQNIRDFDNNLSMRFKFVRKQR